MTATAEQDGVLQTLELVTREMSAAVALCGRDLRYRWVSQAYADWLQRPVSEIVGQQIIDVLGKDAFDCLLAYFESVLRGETVHYEQERDVQGIGRRWVSATYKPTFSVDGVANGWVGVLLDITERKRAERALKEQTALLQTQEELLRIFVKNVPAGVAMFDGDMCYLQVSDRWCTDYGVDRSRILGRSYYEVFPDIPKRWKAIHRLALQGQSFHAEEDCWDRPGDVTWVRWEILPWRRSDGTQGGILILAENITQRKQMEDEIREVSRRLIESQERERARIGRDLHDDIKQRLAIVAIELDRLQHDFPESAAEQIRRLTSLHEHIDRISAGVESVSHQLHPPNLKYLGIVATMKSFCREFAAHQTAEIDFQADNVTQSIPQGVSLCLYRVLQEAIQNAVKHSGVRAFKVRLRCSGDGLRLTVSDRGKGFDVRAANRSSRLGLVSMRERVHLINGEIGIQSKVGYGTKIEVYVPLTEFDVIEGKRA
jgi:PAS domain S-box-containing protein